MHTKGTKRNKETRLNCRKIPQSFIDFQINTITFQIFKKIPQPLHRYLILVQTVSFLTELRLRVQHVLFLDENAPCPPIYYKNIKKQ